VEKNPRELATNRLLDIIRRGGSALSTIPLEKHTAPPSTEHPEASGDKPSPAAEESHPELSGETLAPVKPSRSFGTEAEKKLVPEPRKPDPSADGKTDNNLFKKIISRPDVESTPPEKPAIKPSKKRETPDELLLETFMPLHDKITLKIKRLVSILQQKLQKKQATPSDDQKKEAVKVKPKKIKGKRIIVLDIGSASIKLIELLKTGAEYSILSIKIRPVPPAMRDDNAGLDVLYSKIIRELLPADKVKKRSLYVVLPDSASQVLRIDLPETASKERLNAIKFKINKELSFPINVCTIAYSGLNPKLKGKQEIEVLAVDRRELDHRLTLLEDIALMPVNMTSAPPTLKYLLDGYKGIDPKKGAVSVVDIGATKTTISIIEDDKVALCRTIATGGHDFSSVLEGLAIGPDDEELDKNDAEEYKLEHGFPAAGDPKMMRIRIIMLPIAERISSEISRSHEVYRRLSGGSELQKFILIGGGAKMKRLPEFFSESLGIEVEIGDPDARIKPDPSMPEEEVKLLQDEGPAILPALAIGLDNRRMLNVLPEMLKKIQTFKAARQIAMLAAAVLMGLMLSLYMMSLTGLHSTKVEYSKIKGKLPELIKARTSYIITKQKQTELSSELTKRTNDFDEIREVAPEMKNYLILISSLMPTHIYLDNLQTRFVTEKKNVITEEQRLAQEQKAAREEREKGTETEIPVDLKPTYDIVFAELFEKTEEERAEAMKRKILGKVLEMEGELYPQGSLTDVKFANFVYSLENSGWFRDVAVDSIERLETGKLRFKIICGILGMAANRKLKQSIKELIMLVVLLILAVIIWFIMLYNPVMSETAELKKDMRADQDSLCAIEKYRSMKMVAQEKIKKLNEEITQWDARFPPRGELVAIAKHIISFCHTNEIQLIDMQPSLLELYALENAGNKVAGEFVYKQLFNLELQGRYKNLGRMLERINKLPFNVTVTDVSMAAIPDSRPKLDIELSMFLYVHQ